MTDKLDDVVIPLLTNIQTDLAVLKADVAALADDMKRIAADVDSIVSRLTLIASDATAAEFWRSAGATPRA